MCVSELCLSNAFGSVGVLYITTRLAIRFSRDRYCRSLTIAHKVFHRKAPRGHLERSAPGGRRTPGKGRGRIMRKPLAGAVIGLLAWTISASLAEARITQIEILKSEPAYSDAAFDDVGRYEHLVGRVAGGLDPADPTNAIIQDINLAPRNARGMVEYSTEIELLKPEDIARGNRILLFEVNNRGNKLAPDNFNEGVGGTLAERNGLTSPGDGWLLRQGYTMVWV